MFESTEAEFQYFSLLDQIKGTVRRCTRNAWINGLKQGRKGQVLTNMVRGEICEILVEDFSGVTDLHQGRETLRQLLDALEQELDELANLQN